MPQWACSGRGVSSPFKNGKTDYVAGEYCGLEQPQCKVEMAIDIFSFQIDQIFFILIDQFIHVYIQYIHRTCDCIVNRQQRACHEKLSEFKNIVLQGQPLLL